MTSTPKFPRKNIGKVSWECPHCGKTLTRTIWESVNEWDAETLEPLMWEPDPAYAKCRCGAESIAYEDYYGEGHVFLLRVNGKGVTA